MIKIFELTLLGKQQDVVVKQTEDLKNEVEAIEKKGLKETEDQQRGLIQTKAKRILELWSHLQETKFKIPKSARAAQRAQHERDVDANRPSPPISETSNNESHKIETIYNR